MQRNGEAQPNDDGPARVGGVGSQQAHEEAAEGDHDADQGHSEVQVGLAPDEGIEQQGRGQGGEPGGDQRIGEDAPSV